MATDTVEREILVLAAPRVVWGVITDPDQITHWLSDEAVLDGEGPGADGTLTWTRDGRNGPKDHELVVPIRVVEAEPFARFSFRWNHPIGTDPDEGNSALVEFSLVEEDGGTRLTVVESGIGAVADDEAARIRYARQHEDGWGRHLRELAEHIAAEPQGPTH